MLGARTPSIKESAQNSIKMDDKFFEQLVSPPRYMMSYNRPDYYKERRAHLRKRYIKLLSGNKPAFIGIHGKESKKAMKELAHNLPGACEKLVVGVFKSFDIYIPGSSFGVFARKNDEFFKFMQTTFDHSKKYPNALIPVCFIYKKEILVPQVAEKILKSKDMFSPFGITSFLVRKNVSPLISIINYIHKQQVHPLLCCIGILYRRLKQQEENKGENIQQQEDNKQGEDNKQEG